jgi:hypothetical protein
MIGEQEGLENVWGRPNARGWGDDLIADPNVLASNYLS